MQTSYFVSHAGQTYGPWTVSEITTRIAQMELIATDYIYDDATSAWIPLLECKAITDALKAQRPAGAPPSAPPMPKAPEQRVHVEANVKLASVQPEVRIESPSSLVAPHPEDASSDQAEWFIQKDSHRYGPFTYPGLVKALQEKSVFDYDLVWRKGMEKWVRLAEHELFSAEAIREFKENPQNANRVFFERKYPRVAVKSDVIVHDNRSVWLGQTYQGSEGGSGMMVRNATLVPGQVLFLHFTGHESIPSFNALCEVVSKKYVPNIRDPRSPVPYGMKFVKVDKHVQEAMREFYKSKAV